MQRYAQSKIGRGQESFLVEQLLEADINAAFHLRNKYIRKINVKPSCQNEYVTCKNQSIH